MPPALGEERRAGEHIERLSALTAAGDLGDNRAVFSVPDTVTAGEAFAVMFSTNESGCIEAADVRVDMLD